MLQLRFFSLSLSEIKHESCMTISTIGDASANVVVRSRPTERRRQLIFHVIFFSSKWNWRKCNHRENPSLRAQRSFGIGREREREKRAVIIAVVHFVRSCSRLTQSIAYCDGDSTTSFELDSRTLSRRWNSALKWWIFHEYFLLLSLSMCAMHQS